jgi:hypothetical protein
MQINDSGLHGLHAGWFAKEPQHYALWRGDRRVYEGDWISLQVEHRSHCAIAVAAFESLEGGLFPYVTGRADEDPDQAEGKDDRTGQVQGYIHGGALQSLRRLFSQVWHRAMGGVTLLHSADIVRAKSQFPMSGFRDS